MSWGKLPLSDWQTALLAEDDEVRERLNEPGAHAELGSMLDSLHRSSVQVFRVRMAALWTE